MKNFLYLVMHRWYHWRAGMGWRCKECRNGEHLFPWPGWPRACRHLRVRCVHGDEIIFHGYKRGVCLDCGAWVPELPEICSATGRLHQ